MSTRVVGRRRAWWLLAGALLLPGCIAPSWTITPLRGQTAEQLAVDRARCKSHALTFQTREGIESRAWWGGSVATTGLDPVGYQGCLEAKGYRVE